MTGRHAAAGRLVSRTSWSGIEDLTRQSEPIGRESEPCPLPTTFSSQQASVDEHLEVVAHGRLGQAEGLPLGLLPSSRA